MFRYSFAFLLNFSPAQLCLCIWPGYILMSPINHFYVLFCVCGESEDEKKISSSPSKAHPGCEARTQRTNDDDDDKASPWNAFLKACFMASPFVSYEKMSLVKKEQRGLKLVQQKEIFDE